MPLASAGIVWPFGIGAGPRAVQDVLEIVVVKSWGIAGTLRGRCVDRTGAVAVVDAPSPASRSFFSGLTTLAVGLWGFCALVNTGAARSAAAMEANKAVRKKQLRNTRVVLRIGDSDFM